MRTSTIENAYQAKVTEFIHLTVKLATLVDGNNVAGFATRNWGDVGDMERVLSAVQIAVDVLEVV